jgi:AcrR family transcriptional regulator
MVKKPAAAKSTKMGLYRSFPSKDELFAEWLRDYDARFWRQWSRMANRARGCAMANAAVEITEKDHPARKVIEAHKARLRARLAELCVRSGARQPQLLADHLFLLMEGAQVATITLGVRGPARNVAPAAESLIEAHLSRS